MSLVIRNLQRAIPVRRALLRKRVDQIRHILGVQQFDLAVICISNHHIQRLNRTYRAKNVPTDVLSFPFHEVTVAHGLCHLLGYKHSTEEEWQQMFERETHILQEINRSSGTNLQPLTKNLF
ncbi:PREDICTED: putative ribonuclease [Gekko japonicus]|uniref:Ribonuclease n=1 Tax=Gekko japonicus TaxID=146911 RepID=A0ABM1KH59_GEKJA|nr:PREDICTED: putative ribonuclease [Gekko japonicus]